MPTGGVDASETSLTEWFRAGVACVGMGSKLVRKEWVAAGNWEAISNQVRQVLVWIRKARD